MTGTKLQTSFLTTQKRIQNSVKHLRWSVFQKWLADESR